MRISGVTSAKMVACTKLPLPLTVAASPPVTSRAPSALPASMYPSTTSRCLRLTIAPMRVFGPIGSPTVIWSARAASPSRNSS